MEVSDLLTLFNTACIKNEWGDMTYLIFFSDESGEVCTEDNDTLFQFDSIEELVYKLRE